MGEMTQAVVFSLHHLHVDVSLLSCLADKRLLLLTASNPWSFWLRTHYHLLTAGVWSVTHSAFIPGSVMALWFILCQCSFFCHLMISNAFSHVKLWLSSACWCSFLFLAYLSDFANQMLPVQFHLPGYIHWMHWLNLSLLVPGLHSRVFLSCKKLHTSNLVIKCCFKGLQSLKYIERKRRDQVKNRVSSHKIGLIKSTDKIYLSKRCLYCFPVVHFYSVVSMKVSFSKNNLWKVGCAHYSLMT